MAVKSKHFKEQINLMVIKYSQKLQKNSFITYIFISSLIAIYRLMFMWRISISDLYADEKDWTYVAKSSDFFGNALTPDAGYFVPLTRSIFWLVDRYSASPGLVLHSISCFIVGLCCSSVIIFQHINLSLKKKLIISLCLGCYQSFDLLLWMNINYYLYIVCCFFILNRLYESESKKNRLGKILFILLFLSLGKPQLSLSCIFLLIVALYMNNFKFSSAVKYKFELLLITILISSVLFSRVNINHLNLNIELKNITFALFSLLKIPFVLLAPLFAIGNEKISNILKSSVYDIISNTFIIVFSLIIYRALFKSKSLDKNYLHYFLVGISPLYFSLFVFNNTGWATEFFWNNSCISCMSSRHLFPVYVLAVIIFQLFAKSKYIYMLLAQILFLNTIYLLTNQIF
jgi:hypothetical protein